MARRKCKCTFKGLHSYWSGSQIHLKAWKLCKTNTTLHISHYVPLHHPWHFSRVSTMCKDCTVLPIVYSSYSYFKHSENPLNWYHRAFFKLVWLVVFWICVARLDDLNVHRFVHKYFYWRTAEYRHEGKFWSHSAGCLFQTIQEAWNVLEKAPLLASCALHLNKEIFISRSQYGFNLPFPDWKCQNQNASRAIWVQAHTMHHNKYFVVYFLYSNH